MSEVPRSDLRDGDVTTPLTPEHVWTITGPMITADFQNRVVPFVTHLRLAAYRVETVDELREDSRRSMEENLAEAQPREEQFVKKVTGAVLGAIEQNPDAKEYVVLFDVDETIARRMAPSQDHIIRPAVVPLMATLQGLDKRIVFGLLTTRGQGYLDEELHNPNELAVLIPYLDSTKVISAREAKQHARDYTSKYLDPNEYYSRGDTKNEAMLAKVKLCEDLLAKSPDTSIIFVDDLESVKGVKNDERFRAVHLDQTSGFWLRA